MIMIMTLKSQYDYNISINMTNRRSTKHTDHIKYKCVYLFVFHVIHYHYSWNHGDWVISDILIDKGVWHC